MNNEQINAAIDQIMDYPWVSHGCDLCRDNKLCRNDYCADLNAMAQAEHSLAARQFEGYLIELLDVIHEPILASARQRAEAFLRTLGKWEEAE